MEILSRKYTFYTSLLNLYQIQGKFMYRFLNLLTLVQNGKNASCLFVKNLVNFFADSFAIGQETFIIHRQFDGGNISRDLVFLENRIYKYLLL
jgi:hypothetical protein